MKVMDVNAIQYDCKLIKQSTETLETNILSKNNLSSMGM